MPLLVVFAAIIVQLTGGELPCSHCNMERLGYFTLALGPALNLRFGIRPSHYGISLAGAMFLGTVSLDMMVRVAQNVGPAGWGPVVLGLHVNSWSLIISIVAGIGVAVMLLWERQFSLPPSLQTALSKPIGRLLPGGSAYRHRGHRRRLDIRDFRVRARHLPRLLRQLPLLALLAGAASGLRSTCLPNRHGLNRA